MKTILTTIFIAILFQVLLIGVEDFQNFRKDPDVVFISTPLGVSWSKTTIVRESNSHYRYRVSVKTEAYGIGISTMKSSNEILKGK